MNWQPIETAPKDGTAILAFCPLRSGYIADQRIRNVHWSEWGGGIWECTCSGHRPFETPTHWMPLPAAPSESASTPVDVQETEGAEFDPMKEGIRRMIKGCGVRQEIKDILIYLHKSDKAPVRYAKAGSAIEAIIEQQRSAMTQSREQDTADKLEVREDNQGLPDGGSLQDLPDTWQQYTDAKVCAEAFEEHKRRNRWSIDDIDQGLMISWFANVIMAVHDSMHREQEQQRSDATTLEQRLEMLASNKENILIWCSSEHAPDMRYYVHSTKFNDKICDTWGDTIPEALTALEQKLNNQQ